MVQQGVLTVQSKRERAVEALAGVLKVQSVDVVEDVFAEDERVFHDRDICQKPHCKECKALNTVR